MRYPPPYSADFNPIATWSRIKSHLGATGARTFATLIAAIGNALGRVTPHHCRGLFSIVANPCFHHEPVTSPDRTPPQPRLV